MEDSQRDVRAANARREAARARWMARFYFAHVPVLAASVFLLDFETFTKMSLLYTTVVSAITAGATYGAKQKGADAEEAGFENP